jgi:hypothetical protein
MQVTTCQVGAMLRLDAATRLVILSREGGRVVLSAIAPAGTALVFDGAPLRPQRGNAGTWTFLFSLHAVRRFVFGRYEVQVWLPGEVIPLASPCLDAVHVGITKLPTEPMRPGPVLPLFTSPPLPPAVVASPRHNPRAAGGGDLCEVRVCH